MLTKDVGAEALLSRTDYAARKRIPRIEAAEYLQIKHGLRCKPSSLNVMGCRGTGPKYIRIQNRAFYCLRDLDEWASSKISGAITKYSDLRDRKEAA